MTGYLTVDEHGYTLRIPHGGGPFGPTPFDDDETLTGWERQEIGRHWREAEQAAIQLARLGAELCDDIRNMRRLHRYDGRTGRGVPSHVAGQLERAVTATVLHLGHATHRQAVAEKAEQEGLTDG